MRMHVCSSLNKGVMMNNPFGNWNNITNEAKKTKKTFLDMFENWKEKQNRTDDVENSIDDIDGDDERVKKHDEDPLKELSTLDERVKNLKSKTIKRVAGVALFLSVGMFIIVGLVKTAIVLSKDDERKDVPTKVQDLKLEINSLTKWQEIKDQQVEQLGTDIKNVEQNMSNKMDVLHQTISQDLVNTASNINESMKVLQESTKNTISSSLEEIKTEIQKVNEEAKQYTDQKNLTVAEKIAQIESKTKEKQLDFNKLSLPSLPKPEEHNASQIPSNLYAAGAPSSAGAKIEIIEEPMGEGTPLDFTTFEAPSEVNTTIELPKMTIMAGFQKAMLTTGADVPTLQKGNDLTRNVWLSTTGEMLISNGHTENIKECIIQAAATGNFASASADIRLTKISCSAIDEDGQHYKLVGTVKGWVYGENGKQGLKGRLVTKEGELIEKAIPLTLLEGAIKALENSTKSSSTVYAYPGTTGSTDMSNIQDSFTDGATKTASTTLDKFSDYYLMILEQLNPTIELKAGREVTIGFEGGEMLQLEKYIPADVDYFENKKGSE